MKKILFSSLLALLVAAPASAATFGSGQQYILPSGQSSMGNLYAAGAVVTINGDTQSDAMLAGSDVSVFGHVNNDLTAAGGSVDVYGDVGDDARLAGGSVTISKGVKGDLVIAGGKVDVLPTAVIEGDVYVVGGQVSLNGDIRGHVFVKGGTVMLDGSYKQAVDVTAAESFSVSPSAQFSGPISYHAPTMVDFPSSVAPSQISYTKVEKMDTPGWAKSWEARVSNPGFRLALVLGLYFFKLVSIFLVAWLLVHYSKKFLPAIVDQSLKQPWAELGRGFVISIVTPAIIVVLFMTLIGAFAGILLGLTYVYFMLLTHVFSGILVGAWLQKWISKAKTIELTASWTLLGVAICSLLVWIPIVGWIAGAIIYLITLGSAAIVSFNRHKTII